MVTVFPDQRKIEESSRVRKEVRLKYRTYVSRYLNVNKQKSYTDFNSEHHGYTVVFYYFDHWNPTQMNSLQMKC